MLIHTLHFYSSEQVREKKSPLQVRCSSPFVSTTTSLKTDSFAHPRHSRTKTNTKTFEDTQRYCLAKCKDIIMNMHHDISNEHMTTNRPSVYFWEMPFPGWVRTKQYQRHDIRPYAAWSSEWIRFLLTCRIVFLTCLFCWILMCP